ncbi:hypothetical protein MPTK1_1g03140 [Marchantia polymorpha subsp. ruderalis]|uniref:Uncharacterized protein n=4 Tax=Marchantia polymorpha TaxID=3197 RepID=A0AAF6AKZ6_MARPO|nr:hypothetical protein MARPO_0005s0293 [Marchantia polymorpha]BBM97116.1 hypothetical protein Mp_1g03140 [Marchantia polymorpha subsp. ruderalis]|eukprot:PTQ48689.1 hypothetical protein MARPO_0005s0293 [Marchantia polymorpha]
MSHIYGTTKDSNELTPVPLSTGERTTGMTTAESAAHMDTSSPDYTGSDKKKTSLIGKVKAKAKKLKSKLKPGHNEDGTATTNPTMGAHADDSSSASSSDEEEESQELGYTPLSNAVNYDDDKTTAAASRDFDFNGTQSSQSGTGLGTGYAQEDRKFGLLDSPTDKGRLATEDPSAPTKISDSIPLSQFKSSGPAGVEQAVPTEYNYFNKDPESAMAPTLGMGNSQSLMEETPAAHGGSSAGIAPILSDSRAFGSNISKEGDQSFSSGEFSRHDSSNRSAYRDENSADGILAPLSTESQSRSRKFNPFDEAEEPSRSSFNQDVGFSATNNISDTLLGTKDTSADNIAVCPPLLTDEQESTSDTTSSDYDSQKPIHQRAYDGLTGAAVGVGQKLGVYKSYDDVPADNSSSWSSPTTTTSTEPTMAQKAYDAVVGTKDAAADKVSQTKENVQQGSGEPTMAQKAYDAVVGAKETAVGSLGGQTSKTDSSTTSQPQSNSFFSSSAAPADEFGVSATEQKPLTQRAGETAVGWKNSIASSLGMGGTAAGDRNLSASTATDTNQKPLTEKLTEAGVGFKETVASKLGYEGSVTKSPGEQMTGNAADTAISAKNVAASKLGQADQALSSDSTPVSQKAADTMYKAKETTVSTLTPNEDDKALSDSVTESISNLPALLSEKLGFGGSTTSTTSNPSTATRNWQGASELNIPVTDSPSANLNPAADTPDSAASPGIMNRVTGVVSSLFGGGAKKPTSGGEEPSPTLSPSGSGRRSITDTTPMVTDISGVTSPRSSPAA